MFVHFIIPTLTLTLIPPTANPALIIKQQIKMLGVTIFVLVHLFLIVNTALGTGWVRTNASLSNWWAVANNANKNTFYSSALRIYLFVS
jgi:hypothetical protein